MRNEDFSTTQIIVGFKTVVLGLCLYIVELLSIPIFGYLQKLQVSGDGFYPQFIKYASMQPYPFIFIITGFIVILGATFIAVGYRDKLHKK